MAGGMTHEMGQNQKKSLKDPIRLGCFRHKSGYLSKDVIKCCRCKVHFDNQRSRKYTKYPK